MPANGQLPALAPSMRSPFACAFQVRGETDKTRWQVGDYNAEEGMVIKASRCRAKPTPHALQCQVCACPVLRICSACNSCMACLAFFCAAVPS